MLNVNGITCTLEQGVKNAYLKIAKGTSAEEFGRIAHLELPYDFYTSLCDCCKFVGVTEEFRKVVSIFKDHKIPMGFRPELKIGDDNALVVDLKRDISYAQDGKKRPTPYLFSADSANPYEVAPLKNIIANLTCNPAIIYNLFINDPKINVGNKFKDRYEVIQALADTLGSGADISVEVDNPFAPENEILEEIAKFEEILTPYRLVVKVPHTGPTNKANIDQLSKGSFDKNYFQGSVEDNLYGHNLAYMLQSKGYRINFTLMGEPYQAGLGLQVRPYFINAFLKLRLTISKQMNSYLKAYAATSDKQYLVALREYMVKNDYLSTAEADMPLIDVMNKATMMLDYRQFAGKEGGDGLDNARHSLRLLKTANLEDTRLIFCSMDDEIYPNIDKLLAEPEFADVLDRVVITAPPSYLAQHTSSTTVMSYQRLFANAIK